jgi:hypothetical protein
MRCLLVCEQRAEILPQILKSSIYIFKKNYFRTYQKNACVVRSVRVKKTRHKRNLKNLHDNAPATKTGRPLLADSELPDEAEGDAGGEMRVGKK